MMYQLCFIYKSNQSLGSHEEFFMRPAPAFHAARPDTPGVTGGYEHSAMRPATVQTALCDIFHYRGR